MVIGYIVIGDVNEILVRVFFVIGGWIAVGFGVIGDVFLFGR